MEKDINKLLRVEEALNRRKLKDLNPFCAEKVSTLCPNPESGAGSSNPNSGDRNVKQDRKPQI